MKKLILLAVPAFVACGPTPLEQFRAASPSSQGLEVSMSKGNQNKQGLNDENVKPALMPGVTLLATVVVNGGVGLTLGVVGAIIAHEPNSVTEEQAEWGPFTEPLWRHSFHLEMEKAGDDTYTYVLSRGPKDAKSKTREFEEVLSGKHEFQGRVAGNGEFVLRDLDAKTSAEVKYGRTAQRDLDVKVGFRGGTPSDYAYTQAAGGDGSFEFRVTADFATRSLAQETLTVKSRWHQSGEGRSDVTGIGGDLSSEVRFTECWDGSLNRSYYNDTLGLFPTEGKAELCAFTEASFATLPVTP
ncbi:MAG: hypothetical protein JNK82_35335 [Myxococcaceae bacterium]|nr:hypothetical protein [Myxococcaceae bacterium]